MEVLVNKIDESHKEIEFKFSYDEVRDEISKEVKKRIQKLQIPGFRKGKAPINLIKKMVGDALEYEASEKVANTFFWDYVDKENIPVIDQPVITHLDFILGEKLHFKVEFESFPEIIVKDYKGIEIEVPELEIDEEKIKYETDLLLKEYRKFETVEQVGEDRNYLIKIEAVRTDENYLPLSEIKPEVMIIDLSEDGIYPEIIEKSRFKKIGDSFQFSFIDDSGEKNEKYFYQVKILKIQKFLEPILNDDFVKKITDNKISTVEEFLDDKRKTFQKEIDKMIYDIFYIKLIKEIIKRNDFTLPKSLLDKIFSENLKEEEDYYIRKKIKFDKNEISKKVAEKTERGLKWYLIRDEIIKKENIFITEEEIQKVIKEESELSQLPVTKIEKYYSSKDKRDHLLDKKLMNFLFENNIMKKVKPQKQNEVNI